MRDPAATCRLVATYRAAHGFPPRACDLGLEARELDALVRAGALARVAVVEGGPDDFVALTDEGLRLARAAEAGATLSVGGPRSRQVACPACGAPAGVACRAIDGTNRMRSDGGEEFLVHSERWELARPSVLSMLLT